MYLSTFFSKDVPADQPYTFVCLWIHSPFSKFLHQLVVESWTFCWNPKSFRLDFTLVATKKSLLTFVGSQKKQHLLEPTFFFWPPVGAARFYSFSDSLFLAPDAGPGASGNWNIQSGYTEHKSDIRNGSFAKLDAYKRRANWRGIIKYININIYIYHIWNIYIFELYCFKKCKSSQFSPQIVEVTGWQKTGPRSNIRWEQIFVDTQLGCMAWLVDRCWIYGLVGSVIYIWFGNDRILWFEYDNRYFSLIIIDFFFVSWHA